MLIDYCRMFKTEMGGADDEKIDNEFAGWFKSYVSIDFISFLFMFVNLN